MAKFSLLDFFYSHSFKALPVVKADLKGKTVLVVGANTGLGFEAAKHFATMGPEKLILACRSQEKGNAAIRRLEQATGYSKAELWLIDLADFSSVKAFVDRATTDLRRLDLVVLNAAVATKSYSLTKDGWEMGLQVNNLSLSLLALLLLPQVSDTAKKFDGTPRIVVVTSGTHFWTRLEDKVLGSSNAFSLLNNEEYCTPKILASRYFDTKLLSVFFTRTLNRRLKDQSIIIDAVDPGLCYSELRRELKGLYYTILEWFFAYTTEEGSRQLVWASVGVPERGIEELKGAYINFSQVAEPADSVLGEEGKKWEDKLWNDLVYVLKGVDPRVTDVISQHLQ